MHKLIREIEQEELREQNTDFAPGDTVKVHVRIVEEGKGRKKEKTTRTQAFEGVCIARSGTCVNASFTVRRVSHQIGVERTFLLNSPSIQKIEVTRRGRARRAKLYYLRHRTGKRARVQERRRV